MGDPWKSITPKGVQAFVNASIATLLVWLTVENHLSMVANSLIDLLSSKTFVLIVYYAIAVIILYKLLYKRSSYDVNEKLATKFAMISMILILVNPVAKRMMMVTLMSSATTIRWFGRELLLLKVVTTVQTIQMLMASVFIRMPSKCATGFITIAIPVHTAR